jgi:hypothetical protein
MKLFTYSQKPGSFLAYVPGFIISSYLAYEKPVLAGLGWVVAKIGC